MRPPPCVFDAERAGGGTRKGRRAGPFGARERPSARADRRAQLLAFPPGRTG
jgi:hypothetical protein